MDAERSYWNGRVSRRGILRGGAIGGAGLLGAALIGCSSSPSKPPAASSGAPATGGSAASAAAQPQVSDQFIAIQTRDAVSLEPLDAQVYTVAERIGLVYPRLIYGQRNDPNGKDLSDTKYVPSYAVKGWELNGDGTKMTFHMNQGIKYQNIAPLNGRVLKSSDVKYSINRYITNSKSTFQSRFTDINTIETPDDNTVVFNLKTPSRYIIWSLASESSFITPPETDSPADGYKKVAIGPGPYIHDQYLQGEGSKLHANPDYVDAAHVYFKNFNFKVITDASTRDAAMKTSQGDYIDAVLTPTDLKTMEGPAITSVDAPVTSCANIAWNITNPAWADIRLRMAMSKAIDRDAIIATTLQGAGSWNGIVPVGFGKWALSVDELKQVNAYKFDAGEAMKLWQAAGAPKRQIEFYFSSNGTTGGLQAQYYQQAWKQNLGIDLNIKTEDYSIFLPKSYNGKYPDMDSLGYVLPDWTENLFAPYLVGGTRHGSNLDDPKVNAMMQDIRQTLDDNAAVQKSKAVQHYLQDQSLTLTQIPQATGPYAWNSKLRDFVPGVFPPGFEWMRGMWKTK